VLAARGHLDDRVAWTRCALVPSQLEANLPREHLEALHQEVVDVRAIDRGPRLQPEVGVDASSAGSAGPAFIRASSPVTGVWNHAPAGASTAVDRIVGLAAVCMAAEIAAPVAS
jgi:hypothetical protein